jgi:hypothetical protein
MIKIHYVALFIALLPSTLMAQPTVIATVNDEVITMQDVEDRFHMVKISYQFAEGSHAFEQAFPMLLQQLMDEKLMAQEAKRKRYTISATEIKETIAKVETYYHVPRGQFDNFLKRHGVRKSALLGQLESQILWTKLINDTIRGHGRDYDIRLAQLATAWIDPKAKISYKHIVAKDAGEAFSQMQVLAKQLQGCRNAEGLVAKYKELELRKHPEQTLAAAPPVIRDVLAVLPLGRVSHVLRKSGELHLVAVCGRSHASEESEGAAKLAEQSVMLEADAYLNRLRRNAFIEIKRQ